MISFLQYGSFLCEWPVSNVVEILFKGHCWQYFVLGTQIEERRTTYVNCVICGYYTSPGMHCVHKPVERVNFTSVILVYTSGVSRCVICWWSREVQYSPLSSVFLSNSSGRLADDYFRVCCNCFHEDNLVISVHREAIEG